MMSPKNSIFSEKKELALNVNIFRSDFWWPCRTALMASVDTLCLTVARGIHKQYVHKLQIKQIPVTIN